MEQAAKLAVTLTVTKSGRVHAVCANNLADKLSDLRDGKLVREWVRPRTGFPKKCPNAELAVGVLAAVGVPLEAGNDAPRGGNTGNFYRAQEGALIPEIGEIVAVVEEFTKLAKKGGDAGRIAVNAAMAARPYLNLLPEKGTTAFPWIPANCW